MKAKKINDPLLHFKKFLQLQFHLPDKECELVAGYFQPEALPKNEFFIREGKVCHKLAFIVEGVMRYCMFRENGMDVTCFFVSENDFTGDPDSFFSQKPSDKNAQALTDCQLLIISYENMQNFLQHHPGWKEIQSTIDHQVMMKMLYQRTFLLNLDATLRYKEFMKEYSHILQRVPLSYVASFLGITQQSLSRLRKEIS